MENLLGSSWLSQEAVFFMSPAKPFACVSFGVFRYVLFCQSSCGTFPVELVRVKGQTYHTIIYLYQQLLVILSLAYYFVLVLVYCAFDYINVLNEMLHHHYHPSYSWQ